MASQSSLHNASKATAEPIAQVESKPDFATRRSLTRAPSEMAEPGALRTHTDAAFEEYKMFISLVFGVSIFGASTFAVAIGQMTDPADIWKPEKPPFAMQTVRTFLGTAWLCFILAIAVAGFSSSFLTLLNHQGREHEVGYDDRSKKWGNTAIAASAMLWTLLVTAFLFLSLAMVPYAYVPGWFAVSSTSLFGIYVVWMIIFQIR